MDPNTASSSSSNKKRSLSPSQAEKPKKSRPLGGKFRNCKKHSTLFNYSERTKGIIVSCEQGREAQCVQEILDTLHKFTDQFYPHTKPTENEIETNEINEIEEDNDDVVSKSNNDNNANDNHTNTETDNPPPTKKQKRFEVVDSGCKGLVFIRICHNDINPSELVWRMFDFVYNSTTPLKYNLKVTSRIIPVERTCVGNLSSLIEISTPIIQKTFFSKNPLESLPKDTKWAIEYRSRNNLEIERDECIKQIASLVGDEYKVDLSNPNIVLILEVFKSAAAVGVVRDWGKFLRYNFKQVLQNLNDKFKGVTSKSDDSEKKKSEKLVSDKKDDNDNNNDNQSEIK